MLPPLRKPMEIMQHKINVIPESTWMPKWKHNNKMSEYYITQKINKELATGRMRISTSHNCMWMFTIPKADKKEPRFLIDCIPRNKVTIKDLTPLPNVKEIINWVAARKFRSKLDLTDGYHNIRVHPNSVKHNTILTHIGKFDSLVILQGDCNAPAIMMRAINWLLRHQLNKTCKIYIDDILIATHTYKEHVKAIREIMDILGKAKIWFNKKKCQILL